MRGCGMAGRKGFAGDGGGLILLVKRTSAVIRILACGKRDADH